MPSTRSKIALIHNISTFSLLISFFYKFFGYKIYYFNNSFTNSKIINKIINKINASPLNFEECYNVDFKISSFDKNKIGEKVLKHLDASDDFLIKFCTFFPRTTDLSKKLRASIFQIINTDLQNILLIACWVHSLENKINTVVILRKGTICEKIASHHFDFNLKFDILSTAIQNCNSLIYFVTKFAHILCKKFSKKQTAPTQQKANSENIYSVAYFPHQSPMYGNLFTKDYFYSTDEKSPFYASNMLHIEYGIASNKTLLDKIDQYYSDNKIPFTTIPNFNPLSALNFLSAIPTFVRPFASRAHYSLKCSFFIFLCMFYIFIRYSTAKQFISQHKQLKLALVGYDFLFPKHIALALESLAIRSIAVQERVNLTLCSNYNTILDTYVTGIAPELIENFQNKYSIINEYINIGLPRSDLLHHYRQTKTATISRLLKLQKKIVLVLDYHSINTIQANHHQPLINWKNNIHFLEDIAALSQQFKDCYFVIRSKDHEWMKLPAFANIINCINEIENIEINSDYDTPNTTYMIGAIAQLVIAKYTSFGDECLSIGIPVVFHDYASNMKSIMRDILTYDNAPVYATDFSELTRLTRLGLDTSNREHHEKLKKLQHSFFKREDPSAVCPRIQALISERLTFTNKTPQP